MLIRARLSDGTVKVMANLPEERASDGATR
jgi:hypothetical protein